MCVSVSVCAACLSEIALAKKVDGVLFFEGQMLFCTCVSPKLLLVICFYDVFFFSPPPQPPSLFAGLQEENRGG